MIYQNAQGLGFAVSINTARKVYDSIVKTGKVTWPAAGHLGRDSHKLDCRAVQPQGVPGRVCRPGDAAPGPSRAGIKAGDVITSIDGRQMTTIDAVLSYVRSKSVGDVPVREVVRRPEW